MVLRVGRHIDMEGVAVLAANKGYQFVGIAEFSSLGHSRRQITPQRNQMTNTAVAVLFQHGADVFPGCANTGKMGCSDQALCLNFEHGLQGTIACRSSRAEGYREEFRLELRKLPARSAKLLYSFRSLGRKKLEAECGNKLFL